MEAEYGNKFCWGGVLARAIHDQTGTKESVVERRARELVKSGVLEAVYDQIDGKGARCVKWRVNPVHTFDDIMGSPLKELDKLNIRTEVFQPELM